MTLTRKTILITGASSGLGHGIATQLSLGDNQLILTARREQRLNDLAEVVRANGSRCVVVAADATDTLAAQGVIDAGLEAFGAIDVAVLNAGGGRPTDMAEASVDDVLRVMRTNYDTFVNFFCPMIQHMKPLGGTIAYTGSPAGYLGLPMSGPYSASKAAGRTLVDSARIELADTPVKLVALYPGFTYTEGLNPDDVPVKALIIKKERAVKEMLAAIERGRAHHIFPKRIALLIALARLLPEPLRRFVLSRVG